jgi:branched-chain amino acid transport system permease protein
MVLLGGIQSLAGPIVGSAAFTWLQDQVIRSTDYWRAVLGVTILALVLAFPQGIAGALGPPLERLLDRLLDRGRGRPAVPGLAAGQGESR